VTLRQEWRDAVRDAGDPKSDRYDPELAGDAYMMAVVGALDRFMSHDGRTRTGVRRLARLARVNKDTVSDRIEMLERLGWLEAERSERPGASARYQATIPEVSDRVGQSHDNGHDNGHDGTVRPGRQSVRPQRPECPTPPVEVSDPVGPIPGGPVRDPTGSPGQTAGGSAGAAPPGLAGTEASSPVVESGDGDDGDAPGSRCPWCTGWLLPGEECTCLPAAEAAEARARWSEANRTDRPKGNGDRPTLGAVVRGRSRQATADAINRMAAEARAADAMAAELLEQPRIGGYEQGERLPHDDDEGRQ
jgi:hypothetical protein